MTVFCGSPFGLLFDERVLKSISIRRIVLNEFFPNGVIVILVRIVLILLLFGQFDVDFLGLHYFMLMLSSSIQFINVTHRCLILKLIKL